MPLEPTLNVPPWNKRRWIFFKKFISQPSVVEIVARYQRECLPNDLQTYPLWAYGGIVDNYLPDGCGEAYKALLNTPNITEQELINLIEPPVEIISHVDKYLGPNLNNDPRKTYEWYIHKVGEDNYPEDADPLFYNDTSLYLRISPHAKRTEIKAFITEYFDSEMEPHLHKQPDWDTKQSKYMSNPKSKVRSSIADDEPMRLRILALKDEGKMAPEITTIIDEEFKKYIDPQNIRKMISESKKK